MRSKKKVSKADPVVQAGKVKIPTSTILAVIAAITGLGGTAAGQVQVNDLKGQVEQLQQVRVDIAEIKTDIGWIKKLLSEGGQQSPDSQRAP